MDNRVNANSSRYDIGSRGWWRRTKNICNYKSTSRCTLSGKALMDLNDMFGQLRTDEDYFQPDPILIPADAKVPCGSEMQVWKSLLSIKNTTTGPDQIPFWVWKDHAEILTPVATKIWNLSLEKHTCPSSWKSTNNNPLAKVETPKENGDLRGINITPVIARAFEKKSLLGLMLRTLLNAA